MADDQQQYASAGDLDDLKRNVSDLAGVVGSVQDDLKQIVTLLSKEPEPAPAAGSPGKVEIATLVPEIPDGRTRFRSLTKNHSVQLLPVRSYMDTATGMFHKIDGKTVIFENGLYDADEETTEQLRTVLAAGKDDHFFEDPSARGFTVAVSDGPRTTATEPALSARL